MELTTTKRIVSPRAALLAVETAIAHARANGWEVCAAVCDPSGHLVALLRTENVAVPCIEFAIDKAWTAATLGTSTQAFYERAESKPALRLGLATRRRLMAWPGGLPIRIDGEVVGGLGVSGAADMDDVACAEIALARLGG